MFPLIWNALARSHPYKSKFHDDIPDSMSFNKKIKFSRNRNQKLQFSTGGLPNKNGHAPQNPGNKANSDTTSPQNANNPTSKRRVSLSDRINAHDQFANGNFPNNQQFGIYNGSFPIFPIVITSISICAIISIVYFVFYKYVEKVPSSDILSDENIDSTPHAVTHKAISQPQIEQKQIPPPTPLRKSKKRKYESPKHAVNDPLANVPTIPPILPIPVTIPDDQFKVEPKPHSNPIREARNIALPSVITLVPNISKPLHPDQHKSTPEPISVIEKPPTVIPTKPTVAEPAPPKPAIITKPVQQKQEDVPSKTTEPVKPRRAEMPFQHIPKPIPPPAFLPHIIPKLVQRAPDPVTIKSPEEPVQITQPTAVPEPKVIAPLVQTAEPVGKWKRTTPQTVVDILHQVPSDTPLLPPGFDIPDPTHTSRVKSTPIPQDSPKIHPRTLKKVKITMGNKKQPQTTNTPIEIDWQPQTS